MEIARLRALLPPNPAEARAETVREMADLRDALLSLLARQPDSINERDHRPCTVLVFSITKTGAPGGRARS